MVSWMYAFKRGFIIWLWTIVWGIVGTVIAVAISGGSLLALIMNPAAVATTGGWLGALAGIIAGTAIGLLVSLIGNYATIVKIVLESAEETRKPPQPPT